MAIRNTDYEKFYRRITKSVKATAAHFGLPKFEMLVRSCRLIPALDDISIYEVKVYGAWNDEFGSTVRPSKEGIEIVVKDENNGTTDLFFGCSQIIGQSIQYHMRPPGIGWYSIATMVSLEYLTRKA